MKLESCQASRSWVEPQTRELPMRLELRYTITYTIIEIDSMTTEVGLAVGSLTTLTIAHTHLYTLSKYKQTAMLTG